MPILILGGRREAGVTFSATARTARSEGATYQGWAVTRPATRGVTLFTQAATLVPAQGVTLGASACTDGSGTRGEFVVGGPLLDTTSQVTGLPGTVLEWSYSHTGRYEELTVTVDGQHGLATPDVLLRAAGYEDGLKFSELPPRAFPTLGQEPEVDVAADTTTFTFRNSFDAGLRGVRLPEYIPWKLSPTPPARGDCAGRPRQRASVSAVVAQALALATHNRWLGVEGDPLQGVAEWIEEERDMSTEGLTAQALWDQTYGLLGMELHVRPYGTGIRLAGVWPQPREAAYSSPTPPRRYLTGRTDRRERLQTPTALTVRAAPAATDLTYDTLMAWLGDDPARDEISRALGPGSEWVEEARSGASLTRKGFRKNAGQMVAEVEVTTGDVTAEETVDGERVTAAYSGVLLGHTATTTEYDPDCADRPVLQRTLNRTYGYTPWTRTSGVQVAGPGVYTVAQAGELLTDEEVVTAYSYSPQGYLVAKTTAARRLGSLEQENAEDEPDRRGPLAAREHLTTVTSEAWMLLGSGRWRHSVTTSAQTLVPVYDTGSGDAIRTAAVTRSQPPTVEYTDQAPPSYRCPSRCERRVLDETGVVLATGDAGFAEEEEVSLPWLNPAALEEIGAQMAAQRWWREVSTVTAEYPVGTPPGFPWGGEGGVVRELRIQGDANKVTSTVTVARLDPLLPVYVRPDPLRLDPRQGQAVMLAGRPGGARVRLVTGWDAQAGEATVEDAFVAFRTGFPPTPGDIIEWRRNPATGQREATNASS